MDEQERQWKQHATEENAKGLCEFSGYEFKQCILGICDCRLEFLPDDQIDSEVAKIKQAAIDALWKEKP